MTETYEPFQVTVTAQATPVVTAILPSTAQGSTPSVMWYNVKTMYGADNAGNIDSTTVIQNAINAAHNAGGGVVYFQPGTYKISAPLVVYGGIQIRGDGDANTVINQTSAGSNCFTGTDLYQFKLSNIQLNGTGSGTGKGIQLKLSSFSNTGFLHFEDVFIQHFGGDGIDIDTPIASVFDRVITQSNLGNGWNTHSSTYGDSCVWNGCFSKGNGLAGFTHTNLNYSDMNGCAANGNAQGIVLTNCQSVVVNGPGAESNTGDNFTISGGFGNVLVSPRVFQNAHYGIRLTANAKNCAIISAVDISPLGGAVAFVITDAGTTCSVMNINNTSPLTFNGSVTVLNDGSGDISAPGLITAYGGVDTTGLSTSAVSKTGAYTLTGTDSTVLANANSAAFSVTLPSAAAAGIAGQIYTVKKIDASANGVTVATQSSQTIDGKPNATLTAQYGFITVQSDGANWQIISGASSSTPSVTGVQWYNVVAYGADKTGATDAAAAINNAITAAGNAGGGIVYLPAGKYMLTVQLNFGTATNNVKLLGDGQASVLAPTASFAPGTVINVVGGESIELVDFVIQMPSTTIASNPGCYGVVVQGNPGATNFHIVNVKMMYINNWSIGFWGGSASNVVFPGAIIEKLHCYNCYSGMSIVGSPNATFGVKVTDCIVEGATGNTGMALTDVIDAKIDNFSGSPGAAANTGASINIQGACANITVSNSKFISTSTSQVNGLMQSSGGNSPTNVTFSNCIFQKGLNAFGCWNGTQISFVNCMFQQAQGNGLSFANGASQITVTGCTFSGNGQVTANQYDLNGGCMSIVVTGCQFLTPIGTVAGTVVNSTAFNTNGVSTCDGNYFAGGQGSCWPTGSPAKNAVGNIGDRYAAIGVIPAWYDVRKYGAIGDNNADDTVAIQAAVNAVVSPGGTVYFPPGNYKISTPITVTNKTYTTLFADYLSAKIFPTASFVGAAAILINGGAYVSLVNMMVQANTGNYANNPAYDGVQVNHSTWFKADNCFIYANNGWAISIIRDSTGASSWPVITRLHSESNKGGINIQGLAGTDVNFVGTIADCQFNGVQLSPAINLQDAAYIYIDNCVCYGNQGNGLNIAGQSSFIQISNCIFGPYGSATAASALSILTSGSNSPSSIYVINCVFQSNQYCNINAGLRIFFVNCEFSWAQSHGLYFGGTSDQIIVSGCVFYNNGRTAGSGHYDLCCNTAGNYIISGCYFLTGIGVGASQVQNSILAAASSTIHGCRFYGAQGTAFTGSPAYFFGNIGDSRSLFNNVTASAALTGQTVTAGGLAGTTAATRYVGATGGGGPPSSGTFAVGDFVVDPQGQVYICTVAGSPGTWTGTGPYTVFAYANPNYTVPADNLPHNIVGAVVTVNVQPGWEVLVNYSSFGLIGEANAAAHAILSCNLFLDGAAAPGVPAGMLSARNASIGYAAMISNIWKFTGLSAGSHTIQLICQWNGTASAAIIQQSTISATVSRPPM